MLGVVNLLPRVTELYVLRVLTRVSVHGSVIDEFVSLIRDLVWFSNL